MSKQELADRFLPYYRAIAADDAWHIELDRLFGNKAGDARYDARGRSTERLIELNDTKFAEDKEWLNEIRRFK